MSDGQPELAGLLACQRDDLRELLRSELSRRAAPLLVGQHADDQCLQLLVRRFRVPLRLGDPRARLEPTMPPPQDSLRINPERCRLLHRRLPVG